MDLVGQLIFGVVFGLIGFGIGKLAGLNPAILAADAGAIIIILPLLVIILRISFNPESGLTAIEDMVNWFVKYWPGIIIGQIAGNLVGAFTGEN
ncbi:MAG: hypothetical protein KKF46_06100 [Nanoarchaeota archaeon]|nr:hypothetical protein [Nanoarchaeota archaeon]MBU1321905.1 hypothetical protein [Nanoarchaeota archaeon]MBU1598428.1 hypothetical protein [Nanoarchaeota archaeon]MBU2441054.1 hypothetical protein [Nanoarchaeota archaeon]